ncbi:Cupredoxin [Phascolomyces articulosus]|uniref:Cupredoxin n=1 Tax=Phascolomyces articulosus TaxID=60185 RepID=A0AAD5K053_9FUNG|nr:Cupredoxin [Phascolomyces articulosus]
MGGQLQRIQILSIFTLFLFCIPTITAWAHGEHRKYRTFELNITNGSMDPDCFGTGYSGLLINGQFPAPPIRVTKNDYVHVIVHNDVQTHKATTIHFHGILQVGTPGADGVPGLTQEVIKPGETYHHYFQVIDQAGTFYYHAHVGLQDDTISGPFIIYESEDAWPRLPEQAKYEEIHIHRNKKLKDGPYKYDDERILFLSEWWHQTEEQRTEYIMGKDYRGLEGADSYLINGKAAYYPTGQNGCEYPTIDVEPNKVYRMRVIGGLTLAVLGVSFSRHTNLTVIEVDGGLVQPYSVPFLEVAPGQRFSVLLTTDQAPDQSYYINTQPYYIRETEGNGRAILRYNKQLPTTMATIEDDQQQSSVFPQNPTPQWFFPDLAPVKDYPIGVDLEKEADRTIVIKPTEEVLADNTTVWFVNNRLSIPHSDVPKVPLLIDLQNNNDPISITNRLKEVEYDGYNPNLEAYMIGYNETIDFVIHTVAIGNGVCIGHPWHTHGHVHYVLAHGAGEYDPVQDKNLQTYPTPILRDTSFIYPIQPGPPPTVPRNTICGWSKIRMIMTNPGVWAIHCHVTSHMLQGMLTALVSGSDQL